MKKMYFLKGMLLAFLAFQFFSCENEPLTGEFIQEEQNNADEGQFRAQIEGQEFIANSVSAILTTDNELVITGSKPGGENISLAVTQAAVGSFNLSLGGANLNAGTYFDSSNNPLPYISADVLGGYGLMNITSLDVSAQTVTGTFSFVGSRIKVDGDGNPILDGNGDPIMEDIAITNGAFNAIPFIIDDTGGGTGGGNPENEFFAKIDGVDFVADSIYVSEPMVGDVHMIKVEARSNTGEFMRIDVPRSLGVGTFDMVRISDGTKLIGLYNAGGGDENLTSDPGIITITEFDLELGVLKATFAFTGTDPLNQLPDVVEVTEGSFTVYFEGVPGANNVFRANVDGAAYNAEDLVITTDVFNQYPTITITTTVGDQRMILTFPATLTEGTFEMSTEVVIGDEIVGTYTPEVGTSITYVSNPGTITITNYDIANGIIEGTFNFSAVDATGQDPTVYQITGGEFLAVLP
ncbi:DUF6252 family protein [Aequorivita lipolytica]|uniref:Uncharacterized protein n=1 Tax=Aequorivita lipolytica TaxID=153267 RepID=A0A5C6YMT8_9FLAO|nr:DUF6252 family protein [Aequorivita lipolytica]TXD68384.1 hypothetical protein ESV24_11945 [Aequorivita lipolytica]SRX51473.1 hypothetical protein AEQU2_01956 [Aequorivita lipolytica]